MKVSALESKHDTPPTTRASDDEMIEELRESLSMSQTEVNFFILVLCLTFIVNQTNERYYNLEGGSD